ncbi:hypothetical protein [Flavobacterium sp. WG21]|uniref:hypothetical protein n=1 Tax=Flavobacterium sp. WG21 TaxID=1229487 RepID=UPI000344E411|nr:hypothetical protein [Flavobacterium sp. WG21]
MSLIISTYVPEGIIIAGDSRLTLSWNEKEDSSNVEKNFSIIATDTNTKVFSIKDKFGLATFGAADVNGIPISGYINQFIEEKINDTTEIDDIPKFLHEFFGDPLGKPKTYFYLAGYKIENRISIPYLYLLDINNSTTARINETDGKIQFGANWGGESEVMTRLLTDIKIQQNGIFTDLKSSGIPFNFFTLQDAIDFSNYAVNTTIETFRFQQRIKTVGGPVDILSITPNDVNWIKKKELTSN